MKKYSYLLLIPILLTGCSQAEDTTPEPLPPVVETQITPAITPSNEPPSSDPNQTPPELTSQTLSAETMHYLSECALLLNEFDGIYRAMGDFYSYAHSQDSDSYLTNYLAEIKKLINLLEKTKDFIPTDQVQAQHEDFTASSLALAEFYKGVSQQLEESDLNTEEQWQLLKSTFPDLLPILENFTNSAFVLMVGLEQGNLAG